MRNNGMVPHGLRLSIINLAVCEPQWSVGVVYRALQEFIFLAKKWIGSEAVVQKQQCSRCQVDVLKGHASSETYSITPQPSRNYSWSCHCLPACNIF